jgi:hypothetical protein
VAALVLTPEEVEERIERAVAPLRRELERLRSVAAPALVPVPEAARRLGISLRSAQERAADGRLHVEIVGGVRMVRLPPGLGPG